MRKKDVYDLAILKVESEKHIVEKILLQKNKQKKLIENKINEQLRKNDEIKSLVEKQGYISPYELNMLKEINFTNIKKSEQQIKQLNEELLKFKQHYFILKKRIENIYNIKEKKRREEQKSKLEKEHKRTAEEYITRKILNDKGDNT